MKITSTTYTHNGFDFILSDNGVSIPGKNDKKLWFENSKHNVVFKFREALNKFCDEVLKEKPISDDKFCDEDLFVSGCKPILDPK